jgi:hypothetical protein
MDEKIYNDAITIESVEQKNDRVTLVAHNKNRYGFWATRKAKDRNGEVIFDHHNQPVMEDSAAMTQFKNMGLKKGGTVRIGYVIESYTDKNGVNRESKKIINFQESNEAPTVAADRLTPLNTALQPESSRGEAPARSQGTSTDAFGRRLALHGMVNGMLAAGATVDVIARDLKALLKLEDAIDLALNGDAVVSDDLPTIQQGEDINVEDIPF